MVTGINTFKEYFAGYENQYVLIGGAACDIIFSNNNASFRATRDLDTLDSEPFDQNLLKNYGLKSDDVKSQLKRMMNSQN